MFTNKTEEQRTGVVEMPDLDPNSVAQMIHFVYSGRVEDLAASAPLLLPLADRYDLKGLVVSSLPSFCFVMAEECRECVSSRLWRD